ncbi:MAG: glycosyltransferase, partial [Pseudomonadota bacterium]|nr:glycosyltransferase [Pseudomonadota bacterium]
LFKGEGGELEIRPDARTALTGLRHGEPAEGVLSAAMGRQTPPGEVSVAPLQALWRGRADDAYGEAAVIKTVAAVLWGLEKVASLEEGEKAAAALWEARRRDRL